MKILKGSSFAVLSSFDRFTTFFFGGTTLTFRTCDNLRRNTKVLRWDKGYIEVKTKYHNRVEEVEEYIDLIPDLHDLYLDTESFRQPIKGVRIDYSAAVPRTQV